MRKLMGLVVLLALLAAPAAWASHRADHQGKPAHGCDQAAENDGDPYDSTCDGSPSQNGNGGGKATGRPCAGCVGAADNKNPKGQLPNGSDHNNGYECDGNQGIGKGNPAHTACEPYSGVAPTSIPKKLHGKKASGFKAEPETGSGPTGALLLATVLGGLAMLATIRTVRRKSRASEAATGSQSSSE